MLQNIRSLSGILSLRLKKAVGDGGARSADGLAVGVEGETDARRRLSSCKLMCSSQFNLNAVTLKMQRFLLLL
jgi:hypothetical protein